MTTRRQQAVTGLIPPEVDEAVIRTVWPTVAVFSAAASAGRVLTKTIVLAPLAWLLLAGPFFLRVLPFIARPYTLTNRRLMIQKGTRLFPKHEIPLADIDDVQLVEDSNSFFYRSANLEIISKGHVAMTLRAVPSAESFRQAILNACKAWVPGKAVTGHFIAASAMKSA
jgi:Bacterial PH domain